MGVFKVSINKMVDSLSDILARVRDGRLSVEEASGLIRDRSAEPLGFATVDHERMERCGCPEVILASHKTPEQVAAIAGALLRRHTFALITRANEEHLRAVRGALSGHAIEHGARCGTILVGVPPTPVEDATTIPIVTAGTSDQPVAEEAVLTCRAMGQPVEHIHDVGVAGLHRLGGHLARLRAAKVIVCIAGMEGALPSVIGGLVRVPVIAVPTSVGYGASFGGVAALLGMLNSCAAGVLVVNIDNGFGAGYAASLINRAGCTGGEAHG